MKEKRRDEKIEDESFDEAEFDQEERILKEESLLHRRPQAYLLVIKGPLIGKKFQIMAGATRIGRNANYNDIVIDDKNTSRRHSTITFKGGDYIIKNFRKPKNGTRVNRTQLQENEELTLEFGDELEIGSKIFRFCEEGEEDFSRPRKAGSFWFRKKFLLAKIASFVILLFLAYLSYNAFITISIAKQRPKTLQIKELEKRQANLKIDDNNFFNYHFNIALLSLSKQNSNCILLFNNNKELNILNGSNLQTDLVIRGEPFDETKGVTITDVDRNGINDIVVVDQSSKIEIFDCIRGSHIWKSDFMGGELLSPAFGDLDQDRYPDLVVASKEGKINFTFLQKSEYAGYPTHDTLLSSPVLSDIDDDGITEVVSVSRWGFIYVIDGKTQQLKEKEINLAEKLILYTGGQNLIEVLTSPALGDINNQKGADIVISSRHGDIVTLDGKNKNIIWHLNIFRQLQTYPVRLPQKYASPLLADFDANGVLDVLIASLNGYIAAIRGIDGEILWKEKLPELVLSSPALADLDKDGTPDVVLGTDSSGLVYVLNGKDGSCLFKTSIGNPITSSPLVGDLNGDGYLDIILLSNEGNITILGTNTKVRKKAIIYGMENLNPARTNAFISKPVNLTPNYIKLSATGFVLILLVLLNIFWESKKRKALKPS